MKKTKRELQRQLQAKLDFENMLKDNGYIISDSSLGRVNDEFYYTLTKDLMEYDCSIRFEDRKLKPGAIEFTGLTQDMIDGLNNLHVASIDTVTKEEKAHIRTILNLRKYKDDDNLLKLEDAVFHFYKHQKKCYDMDNWEQTKPLRYNLNAVLDVIQAKRRRLGGDV